MNRGHKIIQNFLKKRGAWDNNPYKDDKPKEKQMEPKKSRPADWAQSLAAEATVKIKQPGYNPPEQETIMNKEAEPAIKAAANAGSPRFVDLSGIIKKDKKVAEEATVSIKAKNYNPVKPSDRKDSAQLDSVKADTNRTVNATGEANPKRSNSGAADTIKQNDSSKSIKDLMANLGIENKPVVQEAVNNDVKKEINRLGHQAGTGIKSGENVVDKSGAIHTPMSRARHLARLGMQMAKLNPKVAESWDNHTLEQIAEVHPSVMAMAKVGASKALKAQADKHTEMALAANKAGDDVKVKYHQAQVAKIKAQMQTAQSEGYIDRTRPSGAAYDATMVKGKMIISPNKPYEPYGAAPAKKKVTKLPMSQAAGALAAEAVSYTGMGTDVVNKKKKLNPTTPLTQKDRQVKDYMEEVEDFSPSEFSKHVKNIRKILGGGSTHREQGRGFGPTIMKHKHSIDDAKKKLHAAGYKSSDISHHEPVFKGDNYVKIDPSNKLKEENLDELKFTTMQNYADKAHQQAMDATYDAAHLNRPGEEKLKADAKRLAAKRAGGVQRAQTKMDRMGEELEDQKPMTFAHGIADIVTCKRTNRDAVVQSVEGENYTVVYADGSTETGPADYWTNTRPVTEARIVEKPRGWNVRHLKPAGHGIVGKKVRSYDFPGMHDSHYIEGHVTDEDPQSYHIRTTKVVRHDKEEPISSHMMHIRAPKGMSLFGGAPGVYYAPKEMKPAAKKTMGSLRNKK